MTSRARRRHGVHLRPRQGRRRAWQEGGRRSIFRDYLSAALDHVRAGIKAGQSKEEIAKAPSLKGFEDVAQINARIALSGVLESAYDELAKK